MAVQIVSVWANGGQTFVDREHVHLCKACGDVVLWHSDDDITIDFPAGTPFSSKQFHGKKGSPAHSGLPVNHSGGPYKYVATVDGNKSKDPTVHLDP